MIVCIAFLVYYFPVIQSMAFMKVWFDYGKRVVMGASVRSRKAAKNEGFGLLDKTGLSGAASDEDLEELTQN